MFRNLSFVVLAIWGQPAVLFADPIVPSFAVDVYASVTDPVRLSFDPIGNLYVGRDNSGSGGGVGDPVRIHRVGLGGSPVVTYGNSAIIDPDAVTVDVNGVFGSAGAVLVGGQISNQSGGQIKSILPDQTVITLFGPTTTFHNPTDFAFDSTGRLLFTNSVNPGTSPAGVYATSSASDPPSALFATTVNVGGIVLDPSDRIFVSTADGRIEIRNPNGSLVNSSFVTGLGGAAPLAIGRLGGSSHDLFSVNSSGELLRVTMSGVATVIGGGFDSSRDLAFGPGGALYVSEFDNDRVVRVRPLCDFDADGDCELDDLNALLAEGPISGGVPVTVGVNDQFDLNGDDLINNADLDQWLADAATVNRYDSPYKRGDANLDGLVDGSDFGLWNANKFMSTLFWDRGNFDGNAVTDGSDFGLWNANKFTASDRTSAVPEPGMGVISWIVWLLWGTYRRSSSTNFSHSNP